MLVTFRVKDIETKLHSEPAQIRPQELAALKRSESSKQKNASNRAQRNKVDLRDLHIRNVGGQRVEVGIRKSAYDQREHYDNRHGERRDGFWR